MTKVSQINLQHKERLHQLGYKATPTRLAILNILQRSKAPLSAQAIIDLMRKEADPATIYRTLKTLRSEKVIRPVDFRHNHAHYELESEQQKKHHHHLICVKCGASEDISYCDVEMLEEIIVRKSKLFSGINEHSLEFYGFCDKCAKK
jgi:Fur family transcriptional regulator, ferric uptake regulator